MRAEGPQQPIRLGFPVHGAYNATDEDWRYKPGETPVVEPGELPDITQPPPIRSHNLRRHSARTAQLPT
jgi:hypothetical protein